MSEININEIMALIPHRYPFILVDRVLMCEPGVKLQAIKNVSINELFFTGHFPDHPVMPGVLILEAMAQAMGILAIKSMEAQGAVRKGGDIFYFAGIDKVRFKRLVTPGDQLVMDIELTKTKREIMKAIATARVNGEIVCTAELMLAYKGS